MIFSKRQSFILLTVMLLSVLSVTLVGCIKEKNERYILSPASEANKASDNEEDNTDLALALDEIVVHIKGEVNNPGIYSLPKDARLYQLVEEAGGLTENADIKNVNLAIILKDQEDKYIPAIGEVIEAQPIVSENKLDNRVRINYATKEELKSLPGIGDAIADRIIEYRSQKGGFKRIEDIKNVSGIGDKKFEDIKSRITVD